jgi:hypothetical protein
VVPVWLGTDGPGDADDFDEEETDYWRACMAPEPVGVIPVSGRPALVLRTSPVPTTYVEEHQAFVHEMAKTDAADTVAGTLRLLADLQWQPSGTFMVGEPLTLFDASFPGEYALSGNHLNIGFLPAEHIIEWAYHEPISSDDVWITIVRLAKV